MASHTGANDFAQGAPNVSSPLSQSNLEHRNAQQEDLGSSTLGEGSDMRRSHSNMSQSHTLTPSRGGTLKKRNSLSKRASLKRSGSKKGSRPGSVKSLTFAEDLIGPKANDAFYTRAGKCKSWQA